MILILLVGLICSTWAGCIEPAALDPCALISDINIAQTKTEFGWPIGVLATIIEQNFGVPRADTLACQHPP